MILPSKVTTAGGDLKKVYKKTSSKTGDTPAGATLPDEDDDNTLPSNQEQPPLSKKGGATIGTTKGRHLVQAKQSNRIGGKNDALAEADLFNGQIQKRSSKIHKNRGRM